MSAQNDNVDLDRDLAQRPPEPQRQLEQSQQAEDVKAVEEPQGDRSLDGVEADMSVKVMLGSALELGSKVFGGIKDSAVNLGVAAGLLTVTERTSFPVGNSGQSSDVQPPNNSANVEQAMSTAQVNEQAVSTVKGLEPSTISELNQIKGQFAASMSAANASISGEQSMLANLGGKAAGTDQVSPDLAAPQGYSIGNTG